MKIFPQLQLIQDTYKIKLPSLDKCFHAVAINLELHSQLFCKCPPLSHTLLIYLHKTAREAEIEPCVGSVPACGRRTPVSLMWG
jgi:hypothetical protein